MFQESLINHIKQSKGYKYVFMTSFNVHLRFLENQIISQLLKNKIENINLYIDEKQFKKEIKEYKGTFLGNRYYPKTVSMGSTFHPKILLFLGENKAKLILGSSNLTVPGYYNSVEIFNVFEFEEGKNEKYLHLINDAYKFIKKIDAKCFYTDFKLIEKLEQLSYLHSESETKYSINKEVWFLENTEKSMLTQLQEIINEEVVKINIAVPFYDDKLLAYLKIKEVFPKSNITLFIQNKNSTFPVKYNEIENIVNKENIKVFNNFKFNKRNEDEIRLNSNFFHAKVFRFITKTKEYIFYGSANATLAALDKTYKENGNIESNYLEVGELKEFDYFFNSFNFEKNVLLETSTSDFESSEKSNFIFKGAKIEDDLLLIFKFNSKKEDIKIYYKETELDFYYKEKILEVLIPFKILESENNLLDIIVKDVEEETIRCWYVDYENKIKLSEKTGVFFVEEGVIEDAGYLDVLKEDVFSIKVEKDNVFTFSEKKKIKSDSLNEEAFIPKEQDERKEIILDLDRSLPTRKLNLSTEKIKERIVKNENESTDYKSVGDLKDGDIEKNSSIAQTVNDTKKSVRKEREIEKDINDKIQKLKNNKDQFNYLELKKSVSSLVDVIIRLKYNEDENNIIKEVFKEDAIIRKTKTLLIILNEKLLKEYETQEIEDIDLEANYLLYLSLETMVFNLLINEQIKKNNYKVRERAKELIIELSQTYDIDKIYASNLKKVLENYNLMADSNYWTRQVNEIIGYRTKEKIIEVARDYYGVNADISFLNNNLIIKALVDAQQIDVKKYIHLKKSYEFENLLKALENYNRDYNKDNILKVEVKLIIENSSGIDFQKYEVDVATRKGFLEIEKNKKRISRTSINFYD